MKTRPEKPLSRALYTREGSGRYHSRVPYEHLKDVHCLRLNPYGESLSYRSTSPLKPSNIPLNTVYGDLAYVKNCRLKAPREEPVNIDKE